MKVYIVKTANEVSLESYSPQFGRMTRNLYVVASTFEDALEAVAKNHPDVVVTGIDLINYRGAPILIGK